MQSLISSQHWIRYWLLGCQNEGIILTDAQIFDNWTLSNKLQWNLIKDTKIFIQENASQNAVKILVAIRLHCVNTIGETIFHILSIRFFSHYFYSFSHCFPNIFSNTDIEKSLPNWQRNIVLPTCLAPYIRTGQCLQHLHRFPGHHNPLEHRGKKARQRGPPRKFCALIIKVGYGRVISGGLGNDLSAIDSESPIPESFIKSASVYVPGSQVDGIMQKGCNSSTLTLELHQFCIKPSIWSWWAWENGWTIFWMPCDMIGIYNIQSMRKPTYSCAHNTFMCFHQIISQLNNISYGTVKPVCNDHLYNEIYCLWFIQ